MALQGDGEAWTGRRDGAEKAGQSQAHLPRFPQVPQGGGPAEWRRRRLLFTAIYLP